MATEQVNNLILIECLKVNRERLNSLYGLYKMNFPSIEKDVMFFYIKILVETIFDKSSNRSKQELSAVLISLYEKLLEMIGKNLLGNSGRYQFFETKFIQCIENGDKWLFENPDQYISAVSNAILNIGNANPLYLEKWTPKFFKILAAAHSLSEVFQAAKIAAWISGMAQYRNESLALMQNIDVNLLEIILENSNIRNINREKFIQKLSSDPWMSIENAMKENTPPRKIKIKKISGFTGFSGHFSSLPKVEYLDNHFIVSDENNFYIVFVDIFGYFISRISEETYLKLQNTSKYNPNYFVTKAGKIQFNTEAKEYLPLVDSENCVSDGFTIFATTPYSYSVYAIGFY